MNPNIPRLLRLRYAANMIAEIDQQIRQQHVAFQARRKAAIDLGLKPDEIMTPKDNAIDPQIKNKYKQELKLDLYKEVDGKRKAIHGDYIVCIVNDIKDKTGCDMSEANLRKKIFNVFGTNDPDYAPRKVYRDAIAAYIGCNSWEALEKDAEGLCNALEFGLFESADKPFGVVGRVGMLSCRSLFKGDNVDFELTEGATLRLAYMGDRNFLVKKVEGLLLQENDILEIRTPFIVGNRIFADNTIRAKESLSEYVCRHSVISFSITAGSDRRADQLNNLTLRLKQNQEQKAIQERKRIARETQQRNSEKKKARKLARQALLSQNAQQSTEDTLITEENSRTFAPMKEKVMNKIEGAMSKASCKKLCVMGSGSMCFDTIIQREYPQGFVKGKKNKFVDRVVMEEIGSNPGNVMCILGYFGWESYPIAMFDEYPQGLQMKKDFERYHCNTRYVTNTKEGGTNCFSVIHCLDDQTGEPTMKYSKKHAPFSGFPRDKGLTVMGKDATLPKFIEGLKGFLPDVYFYSGDNAGWRDLGKYMHSKGVLVYYEVQSMNMKDLPKYIKCMKESDIVKFSDETISYLGFVDDLKDKLIIQTLGEKGARFNLCGQGWVELAPVHNDNVVDTEGCGDWTTASFINAIGKRGVLKLSDMNKEIVKECLAEAQEYASRNVSYMGTKGIIADDKDFNLAPSDYVDTIMAEMDGHIGVKKEKINNLKDIPAKDLKIYDAKDCLIYRSDYECLNGVERKLEKGECSVMSNFYPCKLPYIYNGKDLVFNSAEQAYHFFRYREFPMVQWMIMQQKDAKSVMKACQGFKYVDSDHEKTRWMYMTLIEELKYLYCKEFRKKINNLGETLLVESSGDDDIFGSTIPGTAQKALAYAKKKGVDLTGKYIGMNGCGRCIMAVREKFRGWTDKQLNEYIPAPDINVWWEGSPAYNELIEGMGKY